MKSFIETQKALLSEIQNGCKRNFILAKEKEETEQKMRQSASMAEIATEDGTREPEEAEAASEKSGEGGGKEGEEEEGGEKPGNEGQRSSQAGAGADTKVAHVILESDSDTEDEEEQEVVTKSNSFAHSHQTAPQTRTGAVPPPLSASCATPSPFAPPAGGHSVISGITVTESAAPPGTPPSPGRFISVSSPGRGHKIFMVTRVESPPRQQQLQLPMNPPAAPSQTKEVSKKPVDADTQPPPTPTQSTQLSQEEGKQHSPAQPTDCKLTEQSPVALNHTLETQHQPREDVTAGTLDPEVTDPNLQAPALPSEPSPAQAAASLLTVRVTESPQPEPACTEGAKEEAVEDEREVMSPDSKEEECKPSQTQNSNSAINVQQEQLTSAAEQVQDELTSASEEAQSASTVEEEDGGEKALSHEEQQEAPASSSEIQKSSLTEKEDDLPNKEQPKEEQQVDADEERAESVLSVQTDQQGRSVIQSEAQETDPPADQASQSGQPASTEAEDSPDDSSADEEFAEALEGEVVGSALPNGLKPEFSLHLLDAESPKPSSCVMEHGASL